MICVEPSSRVVIIGAGMAGATCARVLTSAGCAVQVVDKGHGAAFRQFLAGAGQADLVLPWGPTLAAGSRPLDDAGPLYLPSPDMPSLCRCLLRDIPTTSSFAVDRLLRGPRGWQVAATGSTLPGHFDAVVLALPPAQAATLLALHRSDWAQRASLALMQPCWTLIGVARRPAKDLHWDVGRPEQGPLAWVMRNVARAGREPSADEAHGVVHARAGWSRQHLEQRAGCPALRVGASAASSPRPISPTPRRSSA
jgi:predicted NAD/FAD-dependent oxidoreductase